MKYLRNAVTSVALISISGAAFAQFWDQGMNQEAARSDFNSPTRGLVEEPITYGSCLDPTSSFSCDGPVYWPENNWTVIGSPTNRYWVIHANNAEAWRRGTINGEGDIGPPGQTRSIGVPGEQGHGFHMTHIDHTVDAGMLPRDDGWHFIINTDLIPDNERDSWVDTTPPTGQSPIQNYHLSFGARQNRGNGNVPPAKLNGPDHWYAGDFQYRSFDAQQVVSDSGTKGGARYRFSGIYLTADWGGEPIQRGLFITLFEDAQDVSIDTQFPDGWETLPNWNWPFEQSFFFPGADWAFVTIDHLNAICPQAVLGSGNRLTPNPALGNATFYKFHLTKVFQCLDAVHSPWSVPFPTGVRVPVTGIFWFQESRNYTDGEPATRMWMQVDDAVVTKL